MGGYVVSQAVWWKPYRVHLVLQVHALQGHLSDLPPLLVVNNSSLTTHKRILPLLSMVSMGASVLGHVPVESTKGYSTWKQIAMCFGSCLSLLLKYVLVCLSASCVGLFSPNEVGQSCVLVPDLLWCGGCSAAPTCTLWRRRRWHVVRAGWDGRAR